MTRLCQHAKHRGWRGEDEHQGVTYVVPEDVGGLLECVVDDTLNVDGGAALDVDI